MIKNFFEKFTKEKQAPTEVFLALEIDSEKVTSSVWQVVQGKTEIQKLGSVEEWQESEKESLLLAVDASVSKALEKISQEPKGIIFGLPISWVRDEQILPSFKQRLRLICEKLVLKPLGFVVTLEALTQFLKKEEGVPLNAILIKLEQAEVAVTLVKLGAIKGVQRVGRSEDLGQDVEEALAHFEEKGVLPARILLFNGLVDFEEARQQLISFSWKDLNFLHLPKVQILEPRVTIKAIAIAGGTEVAKSLGFRIKTEREMESEQVTQPEELGFIEGEVKEEEKAVEQEREEISEPSTPRFPLRLFTILGPLKRFKPLRFLPKISFPEFLKSKLPVFLGTLAFLLAFLLFIFWWVGQKAEITLYLKPEIIKTRLELRLDPEAEHQQSGVLPTQIETVEVSDSGEKETTGKKLIGEKAKGEVTIYNKTGAEKTFMEETTLIGAEGLTFILTEEVKVASSSAEEEGVTYGKANAQVEAASIGTEGNLEGETRLSIKGFSQDEFSAKTETGFSGGTSREIQAVSSEDIALLREQLSDKLKEKTREELKGRLGAEKQIFAESQEEEIIKEVFNHEEGEEATRLSLALTLKASVLSFVQDDLLFQAKEMLADKMKEDFAFAPEGLESKILSGEFEEGKGEVEVEIEVKLQPKLDLEMLKDKLKGKKVPAVEPLLGQIPAYEKSSIKISRLLPGPLARMPYRKENISIKVEIL